MLRKKWVAPLCVLIIIVSVASACSAPAQPSGSASDEQSAAIKSIEPAIEVWVDDNMDDIAEKVGELVTLDFPIARDIAAEATRRAILSNLKWKIIEVEESQDNLEYITRVRLTFPLRLELPLVSQEHKVQVDYVLRIRESKVEDSDIDLDSFQME